MTTEVMIFSGTWKEKPCCQHLVIFVFDLHLFGFLNRLLNGYDLRFLLPGIFVPLLPVTSFFLPGLWCMIYALICQMALVFCVLVFLFSAGLQLQSCAFVSLPRRFVLAPSPNTWDLFG